ncbi:ankyrin repeat domain-containing protein [Virgibacillus sp. SK37]|uniref:ankyrin repeat domain-containing protein n=1 Tax=Virgibacillus sp. SK37 TaxID=403957 RepID=UPI0004D193D5|nr:ankyrin repeat domain-containing protein [Virgibacillus sp. SK37]AIF45124.1 hypothetical protein X953_01720 [Virgibacillus sp. SK37]
MGKEGNKKLDFMNIINSDDVNQLDEYVDKCGVNHKIKGASLLYWTVHVNNLPFVTRLLELGANPNLKDSIGRSPLEVGAYYGFYKVCKVLLEHGGKVDEDSQRRALEGWDGNRQDLIIELLQQWQNR